MTAAFPDPELASDPAVGPALRIAGLPDLAELLRESGQVVFRLRLRPALAFDYVSPSVAAVTGYPAVAFLSDPALIRRLIPRAARIPLRGGLRAGSRDGHREELGSRSAPITVQWRTAGGTAIDVEHRLLVERDAAGRVVAVEGIARRIDGGATPNGEAAERRLAPLRRLMAALIDIDRHLVGDQSDVEIFDIACRLLVERGGLALAWVGLVEPGRHRVRPFGRAGADEYLADIDVTADETPNGQGPVGRAIRSSSPTVVDDVETDPVMRPFRDACLRHGFRSIAVFPLRLGSVTIGALATYARDGGFFSSEERALIEQIAWAVSAALAASERETRRRVAEEALARSESRSRSLIDLAPIGVLTFRGGVYQANAACRAMFGWSDAMEFPDGPPKNFVALTEQPVVSDKLRPVLVGTSRHASFETNAVRADGSQYPLLVEIARIELDDGPVIVTFLVDVSELATARESLRATTERLAAIVDSAPLAIVSFDLAGQVTSWNRAAEHMFGVAAEDALGRQFPVGGDIEHAVEVGLGVLSGQPAAGIEIDANGAAGLAGEFAVWAAPVRDASGAVEGGVVISEDITQRKRLERRQAQLATAIEQSSDSVVITDRDFRIVYVNPAFERISGFVADDVIDTSLRMFHGSAQGRVDYERAWAALQAGSSWRGSIVTRRKDGVELREEAVVSPIFDSTGAVSNYVSVKRDVTRELGLEEELAREARERVQIRAALEAMVPLRTAEETAQAICEQVVRLQDIDSAQLIAFVGEKEATTLALIGPPGLPVVPGRKLPASRTAYLRGRAERGIWSEPWSARHEDGVYGLAIEAAGLRGVAYAPLRINGETVGLLALATSARAAESALSRSLSALAEFAAVAAALVGPEIQARNVQGHAWGRINAVLEAGAFEPVFQPVVGLDTGSPVGFEALTRFADGERPDRYFHLAWQVGLGIELEVATLRKAIEAARTLPAGAWLSLNVSPALVAEPAILAEALESSDRNVVLELTEHTEISEYGAIRDALGRFDGRVSIAVDDAGAGFASLRHVLELRPQIVKLDIELVRGVDADPVRQALIAGMAHFSQGAGCVLVAEGIETRAELEILRRLGVGLGQGFLLGRPAAPATVAAVTPH